MVAILDDDVFVFDSLKSNKLNNVCRVVNLNHVV